MKLAEELRARRAVNRDTQEDAAKFIGVSAMTIRRWERGEYIGNIETKTVVAIARYLLKQPDSVFNGLVKEIVDATP